MTSDAPDSAVSTGSPWRLATRRSTLATTQAGHVAAALEQATGRPVELVPLATTGDDHPDRAIESFDAKGLFVDGVRQAVLDGDCDFAVHSYKDLPTEVCVGLTIGAVPHRVDPRDALVSRDGHRLPSVPRDAQIGTSSARRRAQLSRARRDLLLQPLRGNLDTRLRKVADGELEAIVVAMAGLLRLGATDLPLKAIPLENGECLHAPAQGALAVECREDDEVTLAALATIDHAASRTTVRAERAFLEALQGGCTAPIGAHAELLPPATEGGPRRLELLGMLSDLNGTRLLRASHQGTENDPDLLGRTLAASLLGNGGDVILERLARRQAG